MPRKTTKVEMTPQEKRTANAAWRYEQRTNGHTSAEVNAMEAAGKQPHPEATLPASVVEK